MIISARPYPDIRNLSSRGDFIGADSMIFYPLGRDALLSGLVVLGLKKGDSIIIPAYMCSSTIKPLKSFGFNLVFVDIEKDLSLSIDKLREAIEEGQIKALLVVHYFGFTQNFDRVINECREHGVRVIEDASHSFVSQFLRNKGGIKGDAEIFSMRKSLPIVDGGALKINYNGCGVVKSDTRQCVSIMGDVKYLMLRLFEKIATRLGINIYGQLTNNIKAKLRNKNDNENPDFNVEPCQASWQLKKYLGNEEYLQDAQQVIINNFNQLSQALQNLGFRLLVESVGQGVIPQACVVYDDKGGLVDYLRLSGIGAWQWPGDEMPKEVTEGFRRYPNALLLDTRLVLLPVHQSIGKRQVSYMIKILSGWKL